MSETRKLIESFQNNLNENLPTTLKEDPVIENPEFYWLDNDTFIMNCGDGEDKDGKYSYIVEYWEDDDTFHFLKQYEYDTVILDVSDGKKQEIMETIKKKLSDEQLEESKDCLKEEDEEVDIDGESYTSYLYKLDELKKEIEKHGGLYGLVSSEFHKIPVELLKEIALNAIYELNNDNVVLKDLAERYYDEPLDESEDCIKEDENLELDDNGLPALDRPYIMKWVGDEDGEGYYLIDSIRPYNLTDYSYAKSTTNDYFGEWKVFNPEGEKVAVASNYKEALEVMKDIDSKLKAVIDKS